MVQNNFNYFDWKFSTLWTLLLWYISYAAWPFSCMLSHWWLMCICWCLLGLSILSSASTPFAVTKIESMPKSGLCPMLDMLLVFSHVKTFVHCLKRYLLCQKVIVLALCCHLLEEVVLCTLYDGLWTFLTACHSPYPQKDQLYTVHILLQHFACYNFGGLYSTSILGVFCPFDFLMFFVILHDRILGGTVYSVFAMFCVTCFFIIPSIQVLNKFQLSSTPLS